MSSFFVVVVSGTDVLPLFSVVFLPPPESQNLSARGQDRNWGRRVWVGPGGRLRARDVTGSLGVGPGGVDSVTREDWTLTEEGLRGG